MPPILTPAQQEARLLKAELKALDEHEEETRRMLSGPPTPADTWGDRCAIRRDLESRVIGRARLLAKLVDP